MKDLDFYHKIYFKNNDFILKINQDKKLPNISWSSEYIESDFFYELIRETDNESLVEYLIENIVDQNTKDMINLFKYSLCNIYYLDFIDENEYCNKLLDLATRFNSLEKNNVNFYNPPLLYRLSYLNFNKKDIMIEYNKIIKKSLPIIDLPNKFKKRKRQKIKIGFFC